MDRIPGLRCTYVFLFSFTLSHAANNWKYLNHEISREKKNWTHKIFAKKKSWIHEISPTKIFVSTKYLREKFGLEISCFKRFVTKNINLFISWLLPLKLPDQELRDHLFSTYIKFSEKITYLILVTRTCSYQGSKMLNFAYVITRWFLMCPVNIYLFKVNNTNTATRCDIYSKLTIKTPERRHWHTFFQCIFDF